MTQKGCPSAIGLGGSLSAELPHLETERVPSGKNTGERQHGTEAVAGGAQRPGRSLGKRTRNLNPIVGGFAANYWPPADRNPINFVRTQAPPEPHPDRVFAKSRAGTRTCSIIGGDAENVQERVLETHEEGGEDIFEQKESGPQQRSGATWHWRSRIVQDGARAGSRAHQLLSWRNGGTEHTASNVSADGNLRRWRRGVQLLYPAAGTLDTLG